MNQHLLLKSVAAFKLIGVKKESDISFSSSIVHIPKLMPLNVVQSDGILYLLGQFTSESESWYAPNEGECLAITWSLNR